MRTLLLYNKAEPNLRCIVINGMNLMPEFMAPGSYCLQWFTELLFAQLR